MRGYVVKLSDGSYFCATSRTKKTMDLLEATIFPHKEHEQIKSPGWNIPMLLIEEAKDTGPELIEVTYSLSISLA
jgi:hypothetical protein